MSERSKRRDRELQLIDAAIKFNIQINLMGAFPTAEKLARYDELKEHLNECVIHYCSQELGRASQARAVLRAPETSHDAAEWAKQFALTDAGRVFREIYYTWRRNRAFAANREWGDPKEGLTTDEVEETLNRTHQSISARVNALKEAGWIIDSGQRRKTRSGREAIVWTPTQAAIDFVDEHGMPIPIEAPKTLVQLAEEGEL